MEFAAAAGVAFAAVFVAEFGDKSQLLILAFATRYRAGPVIAGVVLAAAVIQGLSVAVGAAAGEVLPDRIIAVVAGLAFVGVGVWTLTTRDDDEAGAASVARTGPRGGMGVALMVAGAFVVGELGDKTMLATFALAATQGPIPTWVGSTAGEVAANLVAVAIGRQLGHRLSARVVRIGSATLFLAAGVAVLVGSVFG